MVAQGCIATGKALNKQVHERAIEAWGSRLYLSAVAHSLGASGMAVFRRVARYKEIFVRLSEETSKPVVTDVTKNDCRVSCQSPNRPNRTPIGTKKTVKNGLER